MMRAICKQGFGAVAIRLPAVIAAFLAAGCASQPHAKVAPSKPAHPAPSAPSSAGFEATVYETQMPADRAAQADPSVLAAKAAKPTDLADALKKLGKTKVLYSVYQPISHNSEARVRVGAKRPFVMNTRLTEGGRRINMVRYREVGAEFRVLSEPVPGSGGKRVKLRLNAEVCAAGDGGVKVAAKVSAPSTREVSLVYNGLAELGQPFVVVSIDSSAGGKDAAVAYVCRVVLTDVGR